MTTKLSLQNKEDIVEALKKNVLLVKFTKANGEERNMTATLLPHLLPPHITNTETPVNFPEPIPAVKNNPNIVRCYDLANSGWRSFRIDSINEIVQI